MTPVITVLVLLHALAAIVFFGLGLPLARLAKAAAAHTGEARAALLDQGARSIATMTLAGIAAAVLAYATLGLGMSAGRSYGGAYHAASALILVLLAVHVFGTARAWKALSGDQPAVAVGKVSALVGVNHLIWVVLFVLMFAKYFGA